MEPQNQIPMQSPAIQPQEPMAQPPPAVPPTGGSKTKGGNVGKILGIVLGSVIIIFAFFAWLGLRLEKRGKDLSNNIQNNNQKQNQIEQEYGMSGKWYWRDDKYTVIDGGDGKKSYQSADFSLDLKVDSGGNLTGYWEGTMQNGNKVDGCEPSKDKTLPCITGKFGKFDKNEVEVDFTTSYSKDNKGRAYILYNPESNVLVWRTIERPKRDFYAPNDVVLLRDKNYIPVDNGSNQKATTNVDPNALESWVGVWGMKKANSNQSSILTISAVDNKKNKIDFEIDALELSMQGRATIYGQVAGFAEDNHIGDYKVLYCDISFNKNGRVITLTANKECIFDDGSSISGDSLDIINGDYVSEDRGLKVATNIDLAKFLPGKRFTKNCGPGEWGIFIPDGTLPLAWFLEGGVNEKLQKDRTVAKWRIINNQLIIEGSGMSDGVYKDFQEGISFDGSRHLRGDDIGCMLIGNVFSPEWHTYEYEVSSEDYEKMFFAKFPLLKNYR